MILVVHNGYLSLEIDEGVDGLVPVLSSVFGGLKIVTALFRLSRKVKTMSPMSLELSAAQHVVLRWSNGASSDLKRGAVMRLPAWHFQMWRYISYLSMASTLTRFGTSEYLRTPSMGMGLQLNMIAISSCL